MTSQTPQLIRTFFEPQQIAFVGASERGTYPAGIMENLIRNGFTDNLFPVNPKREQVFGLPAYPSVLDLPRKPDLALVTVPRSAVIPVIQDCIRMEIPGAVVISAGFAEGDAAGKALQKDLETLVNQHPIRMIGPNCAGLASLPTSLVATRLFADLIPGPVSFASQSGALMMSLQGVFADRRIGMSRMVSLGNQGDVTLAEMIQALVEDPRTDVITVFQEGVQNGKALVMGFRQALVAGKPIILLKTGRTERGMAAAATHTAALAGEDRVFKAICEQFGVILVEDINPMMATAQLAAAFGRTMAGPPRVGFISQSGGMGSLTADWIERTALSAPPLPETLIAKLFEMGTLPEYAVLLNPADVRGASVRAAATRQTLRAFLDEPEFDLIVMLFARSMLTRESTETARAVIETARHNPKPLAVVWSGQRIPGKGDEAPDSAPELFRKAGIPLFSQTSDLILALTRLAKYWSYREKWLAGFDEGESHD
jgi:acyl-CoA synthetase (NDP forming)